MCIVDMNFVVYTKIGCRYCMMVKELLRDHDICFREIKCDDVDKTKFFQCIENMVGREHKTFPMVFRGCEFIGGYTETYKLLN
jgi:glutaredoxin